MNPPCKWNSVENRLPRIWIWNSLATFYFLSLTCALWLVAADFVRSNGLQEGDFIVLYSDTKCGKYVRNCTKLPTLHFLHFLSFCCYIAPNVRILQMIRGVKVRKPESKQEIRNPGKMQRNPSIASSSSNADGNSSTCKRTRLSRWTVQMQRSGFRCRSFCGAVQLPLVLKVAVFLLLCECRNRHWQHLLCFKWVVCRPESVGPR